jgi:type IV pilus biogenesis protein CpaD/CtpE
MSGSQSFDRRGFLKVGGASVSLAALLAACGSDEGAGPAGIAAAGTRPPLATTTSATVTDIVLLRTATSLHYNAMDVVDVVSGVEGVDSAIIEAAGAYKALLEEQAAALAEATTAADGEAYEKSNPTVDERVIQPAVALLDASDTKAADAANLLHAVATFAAASHHAFVEMFTEAPNRQAAMSIGLVHGQVAAALAHLISPDNYVTAEAIAAAEPAGLDGGTPAASTAAAEGVQNVAIYMVPGAFSALSPTQVVLGKAGAEDATKRQTLNIDSPSLNSMIY